MHDRIPTFFVGVLLSAAMTGGVGGAGAAAPTQQDPSASCTPPDSGSELELAAALSAARHCNSDLAAARSAVAAATARARQSGLLPNPELELELENFGGSGELDGFDGAETTAALTQPLDLSGRRRNRRAVADAEARVAAAELGDVARRLQAHTTADFYRVVAAQQRLQVAREISELVEGSAHTVELRVAAGQVSPVELTRARVEVARAELAVNRAERTLEEARNQLATAWARPVATFTRALGELPTPMPLPAAELLLPDLAASFPAQVQELEIEAHEHALALERSRALPELNVTVGSRHLRELGRSAWLAAVSAPIPLFDRNQGARQAAAHELAAARRRAEALQVELEARLQTILSHLRLAATTVQHMQDTIQPSAAAAFAAVETGYRAGKFSFLDLLQSQQALAEAHQLLIDSRLEYALALTELEALVGPLSETNTAKDTP